MNKDAVERFVDQRLWCSRLSDARLEKIRNGTMDAQRFLYFCTV